MRLFFLFLPSKPLFFSFFLFGKSIQGSNHHGQKSCQREFQLPTSCANFSLVIYLKCLGGYLSLFPKKNERTFQLYEPIESFISSFTAKTKEQWQVAFY